MTTIVPFFEYPRLWSDDRNEFLSIIDSVSSSGGFILQKAVSDFESELANYAGSNFSVGVGNATDGMEIFLEAIGINPGDEIIISSHTMLATASAIKVAGGTPVPVDIGTDNLISIHEYTHAHRQIYMPSSLPATSRHCTFKVKMRQKHVLEWQKIAIDVNWNVLYWNAWQFCWSMWKNAIDNHKKNDGGEIQ